MSSFFRNYLTKETKPMRSAILIFLFLPCLAWSQTSFKHADDVMVNMEGVVLSSAFSGGVNSAQIHELDANGDGIDEWVIWDINSRQLQVYEVNQNEFTHLPELSYFFPSDINGFLAVEDFDGDGKKDLFTSTPLGIKAYRNTTSGQIPAFELASDVLRLDTGPNIQANNLDTPLLRDLDSDGDLDLVIFNFASGDYLEFYKNTSIERKGVADLDGFAFPEVFWGNFVFCGCNEFSFDTTCNGIPIDPNAKFDPNARILHAGGHSILYEDYNGDGISDLVLGRDECDILYYLPNSGTEDSPIFNSFNNDLPEFGSLPQFPRFHVGQSIKDDLVISLNSNESSFNFQIDFAESILQWDQNDDSPTPVLQKDIVDLGENSRPFFVGNRTSGMLYVTYNGLTGNGTKSQLAKFSFSDKTFSLESRSEADFLSLDLLDAQYLEFVDQSGVNQKIAFGSRFENSIPTPRMFSKVGGSYQEITFNGYNPTRGDYLQFFEFQNQDYFLVAERNGGLNLYEIDFTSLNARLLEEDFLGFVDNPANRNLFVTVIPEESPDLVAIDQLGELIQIENFMESSNRSAVSIEANGQSFLSRLGRVNALTPISTLFNEPSDLLIGSSGGGLIYLEGIGDSPPEEGELLLKVYPNPNQGRIKILSNKAATGRLVNALGQIVLDGFEVPANLEFQIQAEFLTPGLYILQLEVENQIRRSRKIWIL